MYDVIIRDGTLVSSAGRQVADVAIEHGRIAYVGPRPPRGARLELSAIGRFVIPGIVDTAVQFEPEADSDGWEPESRAAVTGGVTTVVALPDGRARVVDRASAKARIRRASARSWVDFSLWAAATPGNADALRAAHQDGLVAGTLAVVGADDGLGALEPHLAGPGLVAVHLADGDPGAAATTLDAARRLGRPIHLLPLSTAAELSLIDPVRNEVPVTTACTPHHLFLSADDAEPPVRSRPPVRPEQDRRTLWSAVKQGRLDCVVSDHRPLPAQAGGAPGAELLLPLLLSAVHHGRLTMERLVSLCCEAPARIFGLQQKGSLRLGADADLVVLGDGAVGRVDPASLASGAGWSPYTDRECAPKPEWVLLRGALVAQRGAISAPGPTGTPVPASRRGTPAAR